MNISDFNSLDAVVRQIKNERFEYGFRFNNRSFHTLGASIEKYCKRIEEINANLSLLNTAYHSANNRYSMITYDERAAIRNKNGDTSADASAASGKVESLIPARTQLKEFYNKARKPYLFELNTVKLLVKTMKIAHWVLNTADNVARMLYTFSFMGGKKQWRALPIRDDCTESESYKNFCAVMDTPFMHDKWYNSIRHGIEIPLTEYSLSEYNIHVTPCPIPYAEKLTFHGRAIVWCGNDINGVPLVISLKCNFDADGKIDGLPETYKILMFKPIKVTATFDSHNKEISADAR